MLFSAARGCTCRVLIVGWWVCGGRVRLSRLLRFDTWHFPVCLSVWARSQVSERAPVFILVSRRRRKAQRCNATERYLATVFRINPSRNQTSVATSAHIPSQQTLQWQSQNLLHPVQCAMQLLCSCEKLTRSRESRASHEQSRGKKLWRHNNSSPLTNFGRKVQLTNFSKTKRESGSVPRERVSNVRLFGDMIVWFVIWGQKLQRKN